MTYFDQEKFKKKLKKKLKKSFGKEQNYKVKTGGSLYFLGFVGAAAYYVSTATDFWIGVVGILKAMVWPAFLVFAALNNLGA
jgi:hypothetical protein